MLFKLIPLSVHIVKKNSASLISSLFENQTTMEQTQTIIVTIYKHPALHSTEFCSRNIR